MALKICGNCKLCDRYGNGIKEYHYVCSKERIVVTNYALACKHFVYEKKYKSND